MAYLQEYEKLRMLGRGAFATIWKVRHNTLGYIRAIKVSKEEIENEQDKAYQTFLKECRVLLQIGNGCHPNIVRIYQPRLIDNRALVEMDYVDGCTLNDYLQKRKFMPIDEVLNLVKQIGGALAYCHSDIYRFVMNPAEDNLKRNPNDARQFIISDEQRCRLIKKYQVIHNDLHSNNVMRRDYDGAFVLLDFGLAIQNDRAVKSSSRMDGALEYKAPEKWDDESLVTTQSDVYGMGVLFYEALAGRVPFVYEPTKFSSELAAQNDMLRKHQEVLPAAIEPQRMAAFKQVNPGRIWKCDYPEWLEQMIMKCLAKNPNDRYADAKEFMTELAQHIAEEKSQSRQTQRASHQDALAELDKVRETLIDKENQLRLVREQDDTNRNTIKLLEREKINLNGQIAALNDRLSAKPKVQIKKQLVSPPWMAIAASLLALAIMGCVWYAHRTGLRADSLITANAKVRIDTVYVTDDSDVQKLRDKLTSIQGQYEALKEQYDEQSQTNESHDSDDDDNAAEISDLKRQVSSLVVQNKQLQSSVSSLTVENKSLKSNVSNLQSKNQKLQKQVDAFVKNLSN